MTATKNTTKLYSAETIRKAHALRKAKAAELGLPVAAISWKSAMRSAKRGTEMTDAWGFPFNTIRHNINLYLWSGDASLNIAPEEIAEALGYQLNQVRTYLAEIEGWKGYMVNNHGFIALTTDKRPWPQPFIRERSYYKTAAVA